MKGYKTCPCGKQIGCRTLQCPYCGHKWAGKVKNKPIVVPEMEPRRAYKKAAAALPSRIALLRIPSGENPVPIRGRDKSSLIKWAEEVRAYWMTRGYFLLREGLCYYFQFESPFDESEKAYAAACKIINESLDDENPHS